MSENWVVQNLQNALDTWNKYLTEIWQLITQSPAEFKGGSIWGVILNIHDAWWESCAPVGRSPKCAGRRWP